MAVNVETTSFRELAQEASDSSVVAELASDESLAIIVHCDMCDHFDY